jgi:hypothetical protein
LPATTFFGLENSAGFSPGADQECGSLIIRNVFGGAYMNLM